MCCGCPTKRRNWSRNSPKPARPRATTAPAGRSSPSSAAAAGRARRCSRSPWRRPPPTRCWSTSTPGAAASTSSSAARRTPGLRWPDVALQGGRLTWSAVRAALPRHRGVSVLSGARRAYEVDAAPVDAVVDAGRRGGVTVVCDLARRLTDATQAALDAADLVVVVTRCDVRACAATGCDGTGIGCDQPQPGTGGAGTVARRVAGGRGRRHRRPAVARVGQSPASTRRAVGTPRSAVGTAIAARAGSAAGAGRAARMPARRRAAGRRERFADRAGARAAGRRIGGAGLSVEAQRGGGRDPGRVRRHARRHGGSRQSAGAADRTDRRRHPRTAAVCGRHHRRPGHRTRCGLGGRRKRAATQPHSASPTRPRCAAWRSGWPWPPVGGSTTRSRGSTVT